MALSLQVVALALAALGYDEPMNVATKSSAPRNWVMTWHDEFDGPNGSKPDPSKWVQETGGHGFGNNELQAYTDRVENARLEDGHLIIEARKENFTCPEDGLPKEYTSARLKTLGKFSQAYGKFEARMKIPPGPGMWPAYWMMGDDIEKVDWPDCGEIDVMENIGREPSAVHGTVHGPGYWGANGIGAKKELPDDQKVSDDFHTYAVEWSPNDIKWSMDGEHYQTLTRDMLPADAPWVFNKPFFTLLNLAVGGNWPGPPDASTPFPGKLEVDYVRAYQAAP